MAIARGVAAGFGLFALLAFGAPRPAAADTVVPGGNLGNQTWTPAGSPYVLRGDVTVQAGATLTIAAGTVVEAVAGDTQAGGQSTTEVEIIVSGTLAVNGTAAAPVIFRAQTGTAPETWYGIRVLADATAATITGAVIQAGTIGVTSEMTASPLVMRQVVLRDNLIAILVTGGIGTLSEIEAVDNRTMVEFSESGGSITNSLMWSTTVGFSYGYGVEVVYPKAPVHVINCTIDQAGTGVFSDNADQPVDVVNSIVTNGDYGLYAGGTVMTVSYSDVWNNVIDSSGVTMGSGVVSANPQYVSATDFHLQRTSIAIDSGTTVGAPDHDLDLAPRPQNGDGIVDPDGSEVDMGAYEASAIGGAGGVGGGGSAGRGGASGGGAGAGRGGAGGGGTGGGSAGRGGAGGGGTGGGSAGRGGAGGGGTGGRGGANTGGTGGAAGAGGSAGTSGTAGVGATGAAGTGGATGATGTAGTSGAAGASATGGASGANGGAGRAGGGGTTATSGSSGCGCRAASADSWSFSSLLLAAMLLLRSRRNPLWVGRFARRAPWHRPGSARATRRVSS